MMRKFIHIAGLLIIIVGSLHSQTPLQHEKKVYVCPEHKIYVQKSLPVFLRLSTSADDKADSYLLQSGSTPAYTNPMYLDSEGKNTIRSPWAVDTSTLKTVYPQQDIVFEVYADGTAPKTVATEKNSPVFHKDNKPIYGKKLEITLEATDETSGVASSYFSLNQEAYKPYTSPLTCNEEKEYTLRFYSVDQVGNTEAPQEKAFQVDLSPPSLSYSFEGSKKDNYLTSDTKIRFDSEDKISGVKGIYYNVNGGPFKKYITPLPLSSFKSDSLFIRYYAEDHAGNKTEEKSIGTSYSSAREGKGLVFDYYVDDEPPSVDIHIDGDMYEGKYTYISERSKIVIKADDQKSGVADVFYGVNVTQPASRYTTPFSMMEGSFQKILYYAVDYVENASLPKQKIYYLDKTTALSSTQFEGPQFFNRDTLFICSLTKIKLTSMDKESGVQNTFYSIDSGDIKEFNEPIRTEKEGYHMLQYFATDHVNNKEEAKTQGYIVDNKPPDIFHHFSVEPIGTKTVRDKIYTIYPSNTKLYIAATDNASGGEYIEYRINGGKVQTQLPIENFAPGNYEIEIKASDVLKNDTAKTVSFSIEK